MGNTEAWPVLRTTDLAEALTLAERLLSVALWYKPSGCYLEAWASDDDELRRLTEASPEANVRWYGEGGVGFPAMLTWGVATPSQGSQALRTWADITTCYILWHDLEWPAVPELGLGEEYKYAELQVACNSHTIHCEKWAPEHTVFIHARPGHDERAAWLAAQVDGHVVGPSEEGW
ncbi:hypothetical protein [Streptomyces sp. NPDC127038]|uniref:hypothetical protein n=1 Tax=Streptomyces sp. NPDC127038 TaxID=3347114 RepID=UPI00365517CF